MSRRTDLDWVRAVSILGVVLSHSSSLFVSRPSRLAFLGVTPALLCNQVPRFNIPVFFLLSGLGLCLSRRPLKLPGFWLRRLWKVGVPYVLWTVFYFLAASDFDFSTLLAPGAFAALGRNCLTGGAAPHLWFIPVMLQFYLLYPGLKWLMDRAPLWTLLGAFLLTLFCTLLLYIPLPLTGWWRPYLWELFPTWLFFFVLGMAIDEKKLDRLRDFARKRALPLVLLAAAGALLYTWDALRSGNLDSIKPQQFIYGPLCFLGLLAAWKWLEGKRGAVVPSGYLSRHSMAIYFSHVFFIQRLRRTDFFNQNLLTMLLVFLIALCLSLVLAALPELWSRFRKRRKTA